MSSKSIDQGQSNKLLFLAQKENSLSPTLVNVVAQNAFAESSRSRGAKNLNVSSHKSIPNSDLAVVSKEEEEDYKPVPVPRRKP